MRFILISVLAVTLSQEVMAGDGVGSRERLAVLQKIQGHWERACRKVFVNSRTVYEHTWLSSSFTHLNFKTIEYSDARCFKPLREYTTRYRYTLGDTLLTRTGDKATVLNVMSDEPEPGVIRLRPRNIVRFDSGRLVFGLMDPAKSDTAQLTELDFQSAFLRQ